MPIWLATMGNSAWQDTLYDAVQALRVPALRIAHGEHPDCAGVGLG